MTLSIERHLLQQLGVPNGIIPAELTKELDNLNMRMLIQGARTDTRRTITCIDMLWMIAHYYGVNHPLELRIARAEYENLCRLGDSYVQMAWFSKQLDESMNRIGEKELQANWQHRIELVIFNALSESELLKIPLSIYTANCALDRICIYIYIYIYVY